jgi:hypothetical protein
MVVGKAVGATITAHFAARMAGEALSTSEADDLCKAEFDERAAQPLTDFGEDDPADLREQAQEALHAYLTELAPSVAGLGRAPLRAPLRRRRSGRSSATSTSRTRRATRSTSRSGPST